MANLENLGQLELERVTSVLLHYMDQDTRRKLMAACPVEYGKMFPQVPVSTITGYVVQAIDSARFQASEKAFVG